MPRFAIRWDSLAMNLQGTLMLPGAPHFETARRIWNAMIDRRPAAIAVCASRADVVTAIRFAAEAGLKVTVRGGGHSVGGLAIQDDTLLIDLGGMRAVDVDARHRRATVAGGALWRDFDAVAGAFGLATTGGMISTTGVGGLTLGGGIGWLMRKYGLASDNLLGAEVVLASGETVRPSNDRHADLFRVLRGGGVRLGVVTQFDFKLHPVSTVLAGGLWCKAERAADVLRTFREFSAQIPDELTMVAIATVAPPAPFVPPALHGKPVIIIACCWCGEQQAGERVLAPLRAQLRAEVDHARIAAVSRLAGEPRPDRTARNAQLLAQQLPADSRRCGNRLDCSALAGTADAAVNDSCASSGRRGEARTGWRRSRRPAPACICRQCARDLAFAATRCRGHRVGTQMQRRNRPWSSASRIRQFFRCRRRSCRSVV